VKACFQERVQTKNPRRRSLQGCRVSAPPFKDRRRQSSIPDRDPHITLFTVSYVFFSFPTSYPTENG
jgi:hypothetical protein